MEFSALPLLAEVGAALAGFATIAGIIGRNEVQADAIFDIVLHGLIAVFFAVAAISFVGTGGLGSESLRGLAFALLVVSVLGVVREFRVYRASWQNVREEEKTGGLGAALGYGALLSMLPSPILSALVAAGALPERAAFLYELALLSHLLVAILLLLYLVWFHFAVRAGSPDT